MLNYGHIFLTLSQSEKREEIKAGDIETIERITRKDRQAEGVRKRERERSGRRRKVFEERSNLESFCSMTFRDNKLSLPHYPQMRL